MPQTFGNVTIYERTEMGLPQRVTNIDHVTNRPGLRPRLPLMLAHYTGVPRKTRDYRNLTIEQVASIIRSIHRWKANEYNYVIPQMVGDARVVVEFAGRFQAAHCGPWPLGRAWNPNSYGVLFLNAVEDPPTWGQIQAFGWLKNLLRWTQAIEQGADVKGHQEVKPTGCPGLIQGAIPGLQSL